MTIIKPEKGSALATMLRRTTAHQDDELIPYLDSYLANHRNTGTYEVVNEFKPADRYFHPSGDCMKCKRLLFFEKSERFHLPPQDIPPALTRTFHIGQAVHSLVQVWVKKMGELDGYPHSVMGPEVSALDEKLNISGSIDDIIEFPSGKRYVLEIKTMNSNQFSRLTSPKSDHLMQVQIYMLVMGVDEAIVLYIAKDWPHDMKEYKVKRGDINVILRRWSKVKEALIADNCSILEWECKPGDKTDGKCPARDICRKVTQ
jgi:hypothetical protein